MTTATRPRDIVDDLRITVDRSEAQRSLDPSAVALLHECGATRLMTPATVGGDETSPRALIEAEREIAQGSPAASWVLMVCAAHSFIAGRFPEEAHRDVWSTDPGMLIPGVPTPRGTCRRTDGGYLVEGRWPYASGVDHGEWVMLGCRGVRNEDDEPCRSQLVVIPKQDIAVDDTWFTLGLRGTGSKDVVVDDVFVPDHRAVEMLPAMNGLLADVERPLYRLPILPVLSTMLMGTIVGMAERGLELYIEQARGRRDAYSGMPKVESVGVQSRVAEASGELMSAWAMVERNCDLFEAAMEADPPMPIETRAEVRWNAAYAAELCRRATGRLYGGAGAGASHDANVLQRVFRDIHTGVQHAALDYDTALEVQGRRLLGVELDDRMV